MQAGTPLEALRRRLADEGMWLGLDPPGRPERSLGSVWRPAPPARCVMASARCAITCSAAPSRPATAGWSSAGGRVVKNVAGYDLTKLQVGGFGGFGIIAEVHLRLRALPRADVTLIARGPRDALTSAARDAGGRPSSCRPRSSSSPPRWRPSRTGSSRPASSAPTPRCRPTCGGSARWATWPGSRSPPTAPRPSGAWSRAAASAARSPSGWASWATASTRRSTSWPTTWTRAW